jgi:hypothetical protein
MTVPAEVAPWIRLKLRFFSAHAEPVPSPESPCPRTSAAPSPDYCQLMPYPTEFWIVALILTVAALRQRSVLAAILIFSGSRLIL